jgi:hypothetical protein
VTPRLSSASRVSTISSPYPALRRSTRSIAVARAAATLASPDPAAAYTRVAGSPTRPACLLDPAGGGAYRRPGYNADITLILQMRLRVLLRQGQQGCPDVGGVLAATRKAAL